MALEGKNAILFADDEPGLLRTISLLLQGAIRRTLPDITDSVTLLTATNGNEASEVLEANHGRLIAAVFDDLMPGKLGREVAARAAGLSVKTAIYSSTYNDVPPGDYQIFKKPLAQKALIDWVVEQIRANIG